MKKRTTEPQNTKQRSFKGGSGKLHVNKGHNKGQQEENNKKQTKKTAPGHWRKGGGRPQTRSNKGFLRWNEEIKACANGN